MDTGDGRHGQVLVLAWGETNAHGNPYHGWSPHSNLAAAQWRPILAGPAGRRPAAPRPPVAILLMLGGVAIAGATPRSQPDDSNAKTLRFDVQFSDFFLVDVGEPNLSLGDYVVFRDLLCWSIPRRRRPVGPCMPSSGVGWLPSRFLADRTEAQRTFQLAERLGSVNAAASQLGTTWPSLRKSLRPPRARHASPQPQAVRQRAIDAARRRSGQPPTPAVDPVFVALNHGELPVRAQYGGLKADDAKRLKELAAENTPLKRLLAEAELEKDALRELAKGNF
jgi:putative transposase